MRIAIDARWIFHEISGIGTYTQELIRHLAHRDRKNEYYIFFQHRSLEDRTVTATQLNAAPNFTTRKVPYGVFSLRNQLLLPGLLSDLKIDVYHSPNYMVPLRAFPADRSGRIRCVTTIHDLIPLFFPNHAPKSKKAKFFPVFKWVMRQVGRRSDVIATVSNSSRKDILRLLEIPEQRHDAVRVIPNGVSPIYAPGKTLVGDVKTILYVGRFDPYKNVACLIEAFAEVLKGSLPNTKLRIIGPEDPRYPEARLKAQELGVESSIIWSGYVADDELKQAYQNANALVLASHYEGFGLPVVEAMKCGTPVICSNRSSLPEIVGDAALLVDPDSPRAIAEAITQLLTDTALARELRKKGVEQARHYTWVHAADLTMEAYDQAFRMDRDGAPEH